MLPIGLVRPVAQTCGAVGALLVAAWMAATSGPVTNGPDLAPAATIQAAGLGALPPGLTLASRDASRHIVRAVAIDLDADGDLDVVANDGSLDLSVWVNDGTGVLTRKGPAQTNRWRADPPGPSVDGRRDRSDVSVQNTVPSLRVDLASSIIRLERSRIPASGRGGVLRCAAFHARTPRAPPAQCVS